MNMPTRDPRMFSDDEIMDIARDVEPHDFERIAPPPVVWNNILAEVEEETASNEASARRQSQSRFSPGRILSVAAAAVLLAGVTVAIFASGSSETSIEFAAQLTDADLPVSTDETADARFTCDAEGDCYIEYTLTALPEAGSDDLELWVINGDVTDMHSLGVITETTGRVKLPANVTADGFPIVDISIEPDDGDETHSGQSVLRGVLEA